MTAKQQQAGADATGKAHEELQDAQVYAVLGAFKRTKDMLRRERIADGKGHAWSTKQANATWSSGHRVYLEAWSAEYSSSPSLRGQPRVQRDEP